jgi:hypothetical protein
MKAPNITATFIGSIIVLVLVLLGVVLMLLRAWPQPDIPG